MEEKYDKRLKYYSTDPKHARLLRLLAIMGCRVTQPMVDALDEEIKLGLNEERCLDDEDVRLCLLQLLFIFLLTATPQTIIMYW